MEYLIALYLAAQQLADDNQRLKTEAAKAIADVQAEANEALKELAGLWRVHCNGLEATDKKLRIEVSLYKAQLDKARKDTANEAADRAVEVDGLKSELDEVVEERRRIERERDDASRQLQRIRAAFEQLRSAVHPANIVAGGGLIGGGVLGGGIAYGNPHRAIALGAGGAIDGAGAGFSGGWLSSLDGDG